jgi:hypothetical protein
MSWVRPLILAIAMLIVILVTPSYVYLRGRVDISAITWLLRLEQDEPLRFFLTLDPIYLLNGFMKYLFVIIVFIFYNNQTTLKRALLLGVLLEILTFVSFNFGNLLYIIFPVTGIYPSLPSEYPLPIYLLIFLVLALLIPQIDSEQDARKDDWLVSQD